MRRRIAPLRFLLTVIVVVLIRPLPGFSAEETGVAGLTSPHLGIAYQTWNKPLGVWQTPEQLEYDLALMARIGVRSARVEFVWNMIEPKMDEFDFTNADLLVSLARKYGIRLYPIIGFQWPPSWMDKRHLLGFMPKEPGRTREELSSLMNYADPFVRERLGKVIEKVVHRYRGNPTIAAWVLGNEFGYVEYVSGRQLGYDRASLAAFRKFLRSRYKGGVAELNRSWGTRLESFDEVNSSLVRIDTGKDVVKPPVADFLDFRRRAVADTVGVACEAALRGDPKAPRTYSSIGVLYIQFDRSALSEDFRLIAEACRERGAPLSFYSLNSYLNLNSSEAFHLGISAEIGRALTGLDVTFTEFGLTSTEEYASIGRERQAYSLKAQYLETILDRIPGAHVFTWFDKHHVSPREQGFGILTEKRHPKPVFNTVESLLNRFSGIDLTRLQSDILPPEKKVVFLLPDPDLGHVRWNSYMNEVWILASYLKRFGIPTGFLRPEEIGDTENTRDVHTLILARQGLLGGKYLKQVLKGLRDGRFHVLALSDIPGAERHDESKTARTGMLEELFGIQPINTFKQEDPGELIPLYVGFFERFLQDPLHVFFAARTWQRNFVRPVGNLVYAGANASLDRYSPFEMPEAPLYYVKAHQSSKAVFVPISMGYSMENEGGATDRSFELLASDPAMQRKRYRFERVPNELFARVLRSILDSELFARKHWPMHMDESAVYRALAVNRRERLQGGGNLVFLHSAPPLRQGWGVLECPEWNQEFTVSGLEPGEELISLTTQGKLKADSSGNLRTSLRACESDLWISSTALRRYLRSPPPATKLNVPGGRRVLFPEIAYLDRADGGECLNQWFARQGYTRGFPAEPWLEHDAKSLVVGGEPGERFGVLAYSSARELSGEREQRLREWLKADPEKRAILRYPYFWQRWLAAWRFRAVRDRVRIIGEDCESLADLPIEKL